MYTPFLKTVTELAKKVLPQGLGDRPFEYLTTVRLRKNPGEEESTYYVRVVFTRKQDGGDDHG